MIFRNRSHDGTRIFGQESHSHQIMNCDVCGKLTSGAHFVWAVEGRSMCFVVGQMETKDTELQFGVQNVILD